MGENIYEPSYSIAGFCRAESISEPTYFKLREAGLGPRELRYPGINVVRITHAARLAWQEMMQNPTGENAEKVHRLREQLRAKGKDAARRAVESPLHVSKPTSPARRRRRQQAEAAR
jgi:hypothetical protein